MQVEALLWPPPVNAWEIALFLTDDPSKVTTMPEPSVVIDVSTDAAVLAQIAAHTHRRWVAEYHCPVQGKLLKREGEARQLAEEINNRFAEFQRLTALFALETQDPKENENYRYDVAATCLA